MKLYVRDEPISVDGLPWTLMLKYLEPLYIDGVNVHSGGLYTYRPINVGRNTVV